MARAFSGKPVMNGSNVPVQPARRATHPLRVGLLALPDIKGGGIFGMYDIVAHAGLYPPLDGRATAAGRRVEPVIVAPRREMLRSSAGLMIAPHCSIADAPELDLVLVPDISFPPGEPPEKYFPPEVLDWLRARYA